MFLSNSTITLASDVSVAVPALSRAGAGNLFRYLNQNEGEEHGRKEDSEP